MNSIILRPALERDCSIIAALYQGCAYGVADYIWSKLAEPGESLLQVGERRYARRGTAFSFENCTLATRNDAVLGMLFAYPMYTNGSNHEPDPVLAPYARLEENNSLYICALSVFPENRNGGVGTRLLNHADRLARDKGLASVSLIAFEENSKAMRLYKRQNYREKQRHRIYPHPLITAAGDAVLLVKDLQGPT